MKYRFLVACALLFGCDTLRAYTLNDIIKKLSKIESNNKSNAIGDNGKAVGILQIWPIMVDEVNRVSGEKYFENYHRYCPIKSRMICKIFLAEQRQVFYKIKGFYPDEITLACSWNTGSIFKPIPKKYRRKYILQMLK